MDLIPIMRCANCTKVQPTDIKFLVCGKCKNIHYCSKECQVYNWKLHKVVCAIKTEARTQINQQPTYES